MKPRIAVLLCLLLAPTANGSTAWWVFNGATAHCERARLYAEKAMMPQFGNPYGYRQYERRFPHDYKGYSLLHLPEGLVVAFHIDNGRVIYAANRKACKAMAGIIASVTKRSPRTLSELR
jgi:hypothetical protein